MNQLAWNRLLAAVDPTARRLGKYTAYQISRNEYVTTAQTTLKNARIALETLGYTPNSLAAAKTHPDPHRAVAHASYRKVPDKYPIAFRGDAAPRIVNDYRPEQCQYHVHLWPVVDGVELYGHYEVRPDLRPVGGEGIRAAYRRAREHYRPETGETYLMGVTDVDL